MNGDFDKACAALIASNTYVQQARDAQNSKAKIIRGLLEQRRLNDDPLDDLTITTIINELAAMDSNNFNGNCGVGEREGRIYCSLVAQRHFWMSHGIGRSGSLTDVQPKAAGSSVISKLTNALALDVIRNICGIHSTASCFVVPLATGMSLALCLLTIKSLKKQAKYVIWPRIDQKSAFKCILTAGLEPIVVEGLINGDEIQTDVVAIEDVIRKHGSESILCVLSTTSCFAPRVFDNLLEIGALCASYNIAHVVNNAYGLQLTKACHLIEQTHKSKGRIDCFVQSTDKNFMVPVGGAIIAGFDKKFIQLIADTYPGRASAVPSLDLLMTLLSMGRKGYETLLKDRKRLYDSLKQSLTKLAGDHGLQVLNTPGNQVSIAVAFPSEMDNDTSEVSKTQLTAIGSKLFIRNVSGCRVVPAKITQHICGTEFRGWGAHSSKFPFSYFTAAASVGMSQVDIDYFIKRLDKLLKEEKRVFNAGNNDMIP